MKIEEKSRPRAWETETGEIDEWGGGYTCLRHDVNDNESGTVIVQQLRLRVYLKLLRHGSLMRGILRQITEKRSGTATFDWLNK